MSTPESKTQLRQYDGAPQNTREPMRVFGYILPESMRYALSSIRGGTRFRLAEFASLITTEQVEARRLAQDKNIPEKTYTYIGKDGKQGTLETYRKI